MNRSAALVRGSVLAAIVVARASRSADGQELLAQQFGSATWEEFGFSFAPGGPDFDGDGFAEMAVGARIQQSGTFTWLGSATVVSGRTLAPIHTIYGATSGDMLGFALAWCDDLDGDALADLVVGLPYSIAPRLGSAGKVQIYSTASWALLRQFDGAAYSGNFGGSLAMLPDADGDGIAELVVGAAAEQYGGSGRGAIYVYSGASGTLLHRFTVSGSNLLGVSLADAGDVDGDGTSDLVVGAPSSTYVYPNAGAAYLLSGADGSVLQQWHGQSKIYFPSGYTSYEGNHFGSKVGAAGDFDGDGTPDVWVATERGLPEPAFLGVYSGATGATLLTMEGTDYQSGAFAAGDLTGDGLPEFGVGGLLHFGSSTYRDAVLLFSGSDGKELWRGEQPDARGWWGFALAATEDVNRDGRPDFAVGAHLDDTVVHDAGRVDLLASNDLWLDVQPTHFPTAKNTLVASAAEGPTGNLVALFLTDVNGAPRFSLLALSAFDATGKAQWSGTIPSGLAGTSFSLQAFAVGATGRLTSSSQEALAIQ